jgi:hypothetical protein
VDLRYGQRKIAPEDHRRGKTASAISGHPDLPRFLLHDDPANELLLSAGLGAYRILTPDWWIFNAGYGQLEKHQSKAGYSLYQVGSVLVIF